MSYDDNELGRLRVEIDTLDRQLLELIAARFQVSRQIGSLKRMLDLPVRDPGREAQQIQSMRERADKEGVSPDLAERILQLIIDQVVSEHQHA